MAKKITATQVQEMLAEGKVHCDKIYKSRTEKDAYVAQFGFFYRHGQDAQHWAAKIVAALGEGTQIVNAWENWQIFPKDSYWEVIFRLP